MKKLFTKLMAVTALVLLSVWSVNASEPDAVIEGFTASWANQTFNSGADNQIYMFHSGAAVSSGTVDCFGANTSRNSVRPDSNGDYFELQLNNSASPKVLDQVSFAVTANSTTANAGHYGWSIDGTNWTNGAQFNMPTSAGPCAVYTVAAPAGAKYFRIMRNSTSTNWAGTTGGGQTIRILGVSVWTKATTPNISKTSGDNPASAMETLPMTPVVYAYSNVADAANVTANWYTDNTYVTTTSAPANLSIVKNTDAKTVTVSGTPTTAGTYYYKVAVNETGGNAIEGSVVVAAYVTPAPIITLTSGSANQTVKAGTSVADIVYTIQHATGASVEGLPANVTGTYDNGTYTISGIVGAGVTPGAFNFTVSATPLAAYVGEPVTSSGSVSVKSATAKEILYLTATATPDAKDTQLYPMLNNSANYIVTVKQAAATAPAATFYDAFDLIVLNEIVAGANVEAIALKSVNKPILNLKSFVYNTGRWGWGTGNNGAANNGTVAVAQSTHPIFAGITLNEGSLELLSGAATKGVQPADVTIGGITVATAPKEASGTAVAIHDVPASVREVENAKYLMVALCNDSYDKMTDNALTLLANSVEYLLNGTQFVPVSTSVAATVDVSGISFDGRIIRNANREEVSVFNTTGRLVVRSVEDINMSVQPKGIYFVQTSKGTIKIALTK